MADMTVDEAIAKYGPSELTQDDLLVLDDPGYTEENVAIVTGGGSGIGRSPALAFAANGLTVIAADIDEKGLEQVRSEAEALALSGEVVPITANLTSDADLERIVETAADHGSIRYLINNAGIQHVAPIESFPLEKYNQMHEIMLRAPLALTKHCLPHFRDREDGRGVVGNMCSVHGHTVTRDKVAYNTLKFGLRGLTQSIAAEGHLNGGDMTHEGGMSLTY